MRRNPTNGHPTCLQNWFTRHPVAVMGKLAKLVKCTLGYVNMINDYAHVIAVFLMLTSTFIGIFFGRCFFPVTSGPSADLRAS